MQIFDFLEDECFWGGSTDAGCGNPFDVNSCIKFDFRKECVNQTMPFYVSDKGRYIWSESPFMIEFSKGKILIEGKDIVFEKAGKNLREAYLYAMKKHFPFDGKHLPDEFFKAAQYNGWIEFTYNPTQSGVLEYAGNVIKNGFHPGIFMIDEGYHGRYGNWEFDRAKFPDPKAMVDKLHEMGFKVMLWVVPTVCADGYDFNVNTSPLLNPDGTSNEIFLRTAEGNVALVHWWNGYSAILDMRKDCDRNFLDRQLKKLMSDYGIDGFKFDGGNVDMYSPDNLIGGTPRADHDPHEMNKAWNEFGRKYRFHEYKDTYKGGGKNCIQRLWDRQHSWTGNGINTIIPAAIVQGLIGHPFICPDMIGGGEWSVFSRIGGCRFSEELFVRMAQVSALFPMMQFSMAPWRVLSEKNLEAVKAAAELHYAMSDKIIELVRKSEVSGEPIVRCLEYNYPGEGYKYIKDQFMLGDDILVCPVVTPGTFEKEVVIPAGRWQDCDGKIYEGGVRTVVQTPLEKLVWMKKISD